MTLPRLYVLSVGKDPPVPLVAVLTSFSLLCWDCKPAVWERRLLLLARSAFDLPAGEGLSPPVRAASLCLRASRSSITLRLVVLLQHPLLTHSTHTLPRKKNQRSKKKTPLVFGHKPKEQTKGAAFVRSVPPPL